MKYIQLWLTCANTIEADTIAKKLLDKRLVACVRYLPVSSDFVWKGGVDSNEEVLLIMDSHEDLFDAVEKEVASLHSYDTYVLQAVPFLKVSKKASDWLKDVLQ